MAPGQQIFGSAAHTSPTSRAKTAPYAYCTYSLRQLTRLHCTAAPAQAPRKGASALHCWSIRDESLYAFQPYSLVRGLAIASLWERLLVCYQPSKNSTLSTSFLEHKESRADLIHIEFSATSQQSDICVKICPWSHKSVSLNGHLGNSEIGGPCKETPLLTLRQPFANLFCQPLSKALFPWTPGPGLETRVNGFLVCTLRFCAWVVVLKK